MQTVTGARPRATQSAKLRLSTPAEKESGTSGRARRKRSTRLSVITWSGGPERYITASPGGKNERWLRTTSVFESFRRSSRPSARARSTSRSVISSACAHCRSFSKSSARVSTSRVAEDVVEQAVHRLLPEERRVELHGDVEAHLLHQEDGHRLDLVRRAAVEGRERHLVGEGRAEVEVAQAAELVRDLAPQGLDLGPRVLHRRRSRTAPRASGRRRGRSPRSGRGSCRRGRGRRAGRAAPRPAPRRSASSPSRTRAGSRARRSSWLHSTL